MLLSTAARYSLPPDELPSSPSHGYESDPAALFEAIIESAFLVANADGDFDQAERQLFAWVVLEASERRVSARQVEAIVSDLTIQLSEDGLARRLERLRAVVCEPSARREVLQVAALLAMASAGVSASEREVLASLASIWDLPASAVDEALKEATGVFSG